MVTKLPAVITALIAVWQPVAGPDDAVYDSVPVGSDIPLRWVTVGWAEDDAGGSTGTIHHQQMYDGSVWGEQGTVLAEIVAQSTTDLLPVVRASAFAFYDDLFAAVEADRTLGGVLSPDSSIQLECEGWPKADVSAAEFHIRVVVTYTTT
jgi:hypothetical protein